MFLEVCLSKPLTTGAEVMGCRAKCPATESVCPRLETKSMEGA